MLITIINGCKTQKIVKNTIFLPKITNVTYTSYMFEFEKGYDISFTIKEPFLKPEAIIFNKIRQDIMPNNQKGKVYNVTVIATSSKINNFKPKTSILPNGILFKLNGITYLKKIKFNKN